MTVDTATEFMPVLVNMEAKGPEERTAHAIIDDTLVDFLGKEFLQETKRHAQVTKKDIRWNEKESFLLHEFAMTVHMLEQDTQVVSDQKRRKSLEFGLATKILNIQRVVGKETMIGWMSNLTFGNLLKGALELNPAEVKIGNLFASAYDDAANGIDFQLSFEADGNSYVNLIQLKSSAEGVVRVDRINKSNIEEGMHRYSTMEDETIGRMLKRRDEIQKQMGNGVAVRCFVVQVPSYDSEPVNFDVFGRVSDQDTITEFQSEARAAGLLGKGQYE